MMAKEAMYIDDVVNESLPHYNKPQPITLKAMANKEALPDKVAQVKAADLNEDEMVLVIKRFKTALKGNKTTPIRSSQGENTPASSAIRLVIS
jgi:hypothetical protein